MTKIFVPPFFLLKNWYFLTKTKFWRTIAPAGVLVKQNIWHKQIKLVTYKSVIVIIVTIFRGSVRSILVMWSVLTVYWPYFRSKLKKIICKIKRTNRGSFKHTLPPSNPHRYPVFWGLMWKNNFKKVNFHDFPHFSAIKKSCINNPIIFI